MLDWSRLPATSTQARLSRFDVPTAVAAARASTAWVWAAAAHTPAVIWPSTSSSSLCASAASSSARRKCSGPGSLPGAHTGVGSATNGAFLQVGGALGVAVMGSLLNTRYQDRITGALASYHVPHAVMQTILGSLGGALGVAARVGGVLGAELSHLARSAFVSGMDLALATGACVAAAGCLIALLALPSRAEAGEDESEPRLRCNANG